MHVLGNLKFFPSLLLEDATLNEDFSYSFIKIIWLLQKN